jgi:antirestriction protein ArdC
MVFHNFLFPFKAHVHRKKKTTFPPMEINTHRNYRSINGIIAWNCHHKKEIIAQKLL